MPKTINRQPFTVSTTPGIDYKFFAHGNWKGICTKKNYFNIDQETFEDADNVYVDDDGVLSSRPMVVEQSFRIFAYGSDRCAVRQWVFSDVHVILLKILGSTEYDLVFVSSGTSGTRCRVNDVPTLIENDGKIYIFCAPDTLRYYDKSEQHITDDCPVYVPVRYTYTNMVRSEELESANVLSNKYIERYLYSSSANGTGSYVNFKSLVGKNATVSNSVDSKNIVINEYASSGLLSNVFLTDVGIFKEDDDVYFSKSDLGTCIICSKSNNVYTIYYSVDGENFVNVNAVKSYVVPKISQDGTCIYAICSAVGVDDYDGTTYQYYYPVCITTDNIGGSWTRLDAHSFTGTPLTICGINVTQFAYQYGENTSELYIHYGEGRSRTVSGAYHNGAEKFDSYMYLGQSDNGYKAYVLTVLHPDNLISYDGPVTQFVLTRVGHPMGDTPGQEQRDHYVKGHCPYSVNRNVLEDDLEIRLVDTENQVHTLSHDLSNLDGIWVPSSNLHSDEISFQQFDYDWVTEVYYFKDGYSYNDVFYDYVFGQNGTPKVLSTGITLLFEKSGSNAIIYSTSFSNEVSIDVVSGEDTLTIPPITVHSELSAHYISYLQDGKYKIAISSVGVNSKPDEFLWYFPLNNVEAFSNEIIDMYPISTTEMGVFLRDAIWYIGHNDYGYTYNKSKLSTGIKSDNVISSYDGTNILLVTDRGLAALSYQNFVATEEQTLTFLSDNIDAIFLDYIAASNVKLLKHKYWIIVYSDDSKLLYLYDIRNGSWWKWTLGVDMYNPIIYNDKLILLTRQIINVGDDGLPYYEFVTSGENYEDCTGNIDWFITSQKLHLGTLNYYKRLVHMTINSLESNRSNNEMILRTKCYRERGYDGVDSTLDYNIDVLRTFVKRLNYGKVQEFQYSLRNNSIDELQPQLKLNSIIIKYVVTGVVR